MCLTRICVKHVSVSSPHPNNIGKKRGSMGLSQRALADAVGTSQQQIQRIEAGIQAVRLDLASRIATALNASLAEVFPKIGRELGDKSGRKKKKLLPSGEKKLAEAGLETDHVTWTLKIGFVGDLEKDFVVSSAEKERLSKILWNRTFDFIVFDTTTSRVAINRTKITYVNILFDVGIVGENKSHIAYSVAARFIGDAKEVRFGVDPDESAPDEDNDGLQSQLQSMFFYLEGTDASEDEVIWFDDEDGERVLIQKQNLLVIEVPLLCCEPELWKNYIENSEEDDESESIEEDGEQE